MTCSKIEDKCSVGSRIPTRYGCDEGDGGNKVEYGHHKCCWYQSQALRVKVLEQTSTIALDNHVCIVNELPYTIN